MNHPKRSVRFERSSSTLQSVNWNFKSVKGSLKRAYKKMTTSVKGSVKRAYEKMTTVENWTKTVLFVCVVALAIDPLFFFIPVIDSQKFCFTLDKKLAAAVCVLRTFIDTFYVIHIIFHLMTGLIAPRQVSWRGEIIVYSSDVVRERFPFFYYILDIVSVLPIPQVLVLVLIQRKKQAGSLVTKQILKWVMFSQYIPRSIRIYPVLQEVTRDSGTIATKWKESVLNLFLYLLPSQVIGALWYLIAIETKDRCWRETCSKIPGCNLTNFYCARGDGNNALFLNTSCPLTAPDQITDDTVFNFGMYIDALKSRVVESRDFPRKFFYCFWWGLRNLSALGQNLETSNSVEEIIFAIIICVSGLLIVAVLIGNVQKYLTAIRVDELEEKKRDTEKWMSHRMLPDMLKNSIRRYKDYQWKETRGVDEESLLSSLPKHLRKDIKRHLCLNLLKRVPWFEAMDDTLLDALCAHLKTVIYTEKTYIVREGEPVEDMLFIMRGNLYSSTTNGGKTGFFNSVKLSAGDFSGEDLLTWAMDPNASHLPISRRTVQAQTEVEGFVLSADDLKSVFSQFRRFYSKQMQHTFRFCSTLWRTWAACFIQAAWKRHCRRKILKSLREEEDKVKNTLQNDDLGGNKLNLSAAIYVSKFASNALKNLRANEAARNSQFPQELSLLPWKPADPEFSVDEV